MVLFSTLPSVRRQFCHQMLFQWMSGNTTDKHTRINTHIKANSDTKRRRAWCCFQVGCGHTDYLQICFCASEDKLAFSIDVREEGKKSTKNHREKKTKIQKNLTRFETPSIPSALSFLSMCSLSFSKAECVPLEELKCGKKAAFCSHTVCLPSPQ